MDITNWQPKKMKDRYTRSLLSTRFEVSYDDLLIVQSKLEEERMSITDAHMRCGCYLMANAIVLYNDASMYLDMMVCQARLDDRKLFKLRESYQKERETIKKVMKYDQNAAEIKQLEQRLCNPKKTGKLPKETSVSADNGNRMIFNDTLKLAWFHKYKQ